MRLTPIASDGTAMVIGNYSGTPPTGSNFFDAGITDSNANRGLEDGELPGGTRFFRINTATGDFIALAYGPENPGVGNVTLPWGFPDTSLDGSQRSNTSAPNAIRIQRDTSGDLSDATPRRDDPGRVCFAEGTLIMTSQGPRAIETLRVGEFVFTCDHGPQPIRKDLTQRPKPRRPWGTHQPAPDLHCARRAWNRHSRP